MTKKEIDEQLNLWDKEEEATLQKMNLSINLIEEIIDNRRKIINIWKND